jgi:hypothetical protein
VLLENQEVSFKSSGILEGWYDIFVDDRYNGTIPSDEFKNNFRLDNLLLEKKDG